LGRKPPLLTLADLPGYGHAVASASLKKAWKLMTRDYLETRLVLAR
jgi:GTP-binding protein EngB required for normal cell division